MVKIGMLIGDRYEVLEKIGTGGMSDVYKARDTKLNRNVAVKVLKQEFGDNENFVSKFRVEAQAAAGLMHPNIVNVYDVGEEDDIHYIVMELVEGITLKKYIEKKARLTYKEALSIAIQVSMGIEAAHNNHIIHRDIKPQNIIISKEGKVKVTDFGIAKAATSNTITSNVMGSVHYTSPEQARGGYSDEKSDIYSLGITMFEMLTGRVPFNGETTVAIAIKHIQEEIPSPREYVPEIPMCVEDIVMKSCEKSPDKRYQSMHDLLEDLKKALMDPEGDFVVRSNSLSENETRLVSEEELQQVRRATQESRDEELMRLAPGEAGNDSQEYYGDNYENDSAGYGDASYYTEDGYYENGYPDGTDVEGQEEAYDSKMDRLTTFIAIAAGVIIIIIIIFLAMKLFANTPEASDNSGTGIKLPSLVTVEDDEDKKENAGQVVDTPQDSGPIEVIIPSILGRSVEEVRNELFAMGLSVNVTYEDSDLAEAGIVIRASVEEGAVIMSGETVDIVASMGISGVQLINVVGQSFETASASLTQLGFTVTAIEGFSDTYEVGVIIAQSPEAGVTAPIGSNIVLTVSQGPEVVKIKVPNLAGMTLEEATVELGLFDLAVGNVDYAFSTEYDQDIICAQKLDPGTYVDAGTAIDFTISQGMGVQKYKYNLNITAPTPEEAPHYTSGMSVYVTLTPNDGSGTLLETTVDTFPQSANYYGLSASGGLITMTFTYVDENGATQAETIYREVSFDPE